MTRWKFYTSKINYLWHFFWWGEWQLFRDEWDCTYEDMLDAERRYPEIERKAIQRLMEKLS